MKRLLLSLVLVLFAVPAFADRVDDILRPSVLIGTNTGSGSGTAIRADDVIGTFILTNYHVIAGTEEITVKFYGDDVSYPAMVVSYDRDADIAVLVTKYKTEYVATLGEASDVNLLDTVICVGSPFGLPTAPTMGIISGLDSDIAGGEYPVTRITCPIAPGNSGGGAYVQRGELWVLIGIPRAVLNIRVFTSSVPMPFLGTAVRIQEILRHLESHPV